MGFSGMRHIVYITGTRADFGLIERTLNFIHNRSDLRLSVIVTGMHLMQEFGMTVNDIEKSGFKFHTVNSIYKTDQRASMAEFIGQFMTGLTPLLERLKPDIILLLGDRAEMLAGAVSAAYLGIPIAHIHGGEVTSTIDESARHAITKLANIHLAATKQSAVRILKMGENKKFVYVVGAPGLEGIKSGLMTKSLVEKRFGLDLDKELILIIQHPVTNEEAKASEQITKTLEVVKSMELQTIVIYPSADPGGRSMIDAINRYRNSSLVKIFTNLNRIEFLSLMKHASVLVGNSSAGIIEAASFRIPVVNIGTRQNGRQRSDNILDADYNTNQIIGAIKRALYDKDFRDKFKRCRNPYGGGKTAQRIVRILSTIKVDKDLLQKKISY